MILEIAVTLIAATTVAANPSNPITNALVPSFCYKWTYGRGLGKIATHCEDGFERNGLLCYPICKEGYIGNGPLCWERCAPGWINDGAVCRKKGHFDLHWKHFYSRTIGKRMVCAPGLNKHQGLCYPECRTGFKGAGPLCHQACGGIYGTDCGAGCTKSKKDCLTGFLGGAIAWGPWNAYWPVIGGGWTAITALTNGQCPNPDDPHDPYTKYGFTPATSAPSWTGSAPYVPTPTGKYVEAAPTAVETPYLATVVPVHTPSDVPYGATMAYSIPDATHYDQVPAPTIEKDMPTSTPCKASSQSSTAVPELAEAPSEASSETPNEASPSDSYEEKNNATEVASPDNSTEYSITDAEIFSSAKVTASLTCLLVVGLFNIFMV